MNALALFLPVVIRRDIAFTLVLPERLVITPSPRRRLIARWRRRSETKRLVCSWSNEAAGDTRKGGLRRAA